MSIVATVADRSSILTQNNPGWNGSTLRFFIPGSRVVQSGNAIKARIKAGASGFTGKVYIGHATGSGPSSAYDGNQVKVTDSLSAAANAIVETPMVPFNCIAGKSLLVEVYVTAGGTFARSLTNEDYKLYFRSGDVAGVTEPGGWTIGAADLTVVAEIDVETGTAPPPPPPPPPSSSSHVVSATHALIARPSPGIDCLAGTVPIIPSHSPDYAWTVCTVGHRRQQGRLSQLGGVIACFGDSGMNSLCPEQDWSPYCQNFGIGGSTLANLLNQLAWYTCLHNARGVIANPGINDIITISGTVSDVGPAVDLAMRFFNWVSGPLIWIPICHTMTQSQHAAIDAFNSAVGAALAGRQNYVKVDLNPLICDFSGIVLPGMMAPGENEHLSANGQALLAPLVRKAIIDSGMI